MIVRSQLSTIIERMQEPRKCIQVLAGPRQVGKTTLIKQFLAQCTIPATSLNADEVATNNRAWISEKWQSVRIRMQLGGQQEHILIIDEVQKIDNWSEVVKKEWDYDTFHDVHLYTKTQPKSKAIHRLSTAYPPDKAPSKQRNPALHL